MGVTLRPTRSRNGAVKGFAVVIDMFAPLRDRGQISLATRTQNCAVILVQYVNSAPAPRALLSSGCSSETVALTVVRNGTRLTLTVPYAVMPASSKKDKILPRISGYSQHHLASEPLRNRPVGSWQPVPRSPRRSTGCGDPGRRQVNPARRPPVRAR